MATPSFSTLPVLNARFLACMAIAAGSIVGGRLLARAVDRLASLERPLEWVLLIWGLSWWFGAVFIEIDRHVTSPNEFAVQLTAFAAGALVAGTLARAWDWRAMKLSTIPLGPLMWLAIVPVFGLQYERGPLQDFGWVAWPVAIAASYLLMYWFERDWPAAVVK